MQVPEFGIVGLSRTACEARWVRVGRPARFVLPAPARFASAVVAHATVVPISPISTSEDKKNCSSRSLLHPYFLSSTFLPSPSISFGPYSTPYFFSPPHDFPERARDLFAGTDMEPRCGGPPRRPFPVQRRLPARWRGFVRAWLRDSLSWSPGAGGLPQHRRGQPPTSTSHPRHLPPELLVRAGKKKLTEDDSRVPYVIL